MREEVKSQIIIWVCVAAILAALITWVILARNNQSIQNQVDVLQKNLADFYAFPLYWNNVSNPFSNFRPGAILRFKTIKRDYLENFPKGAHAYRVLYRSQDYSGRPTISSGLIFLPANRGRWPIVSFAHATCGMGPSCAPSRQLNVLEWIPWTIPMLEMGWAVCATDYSGIGTSGTHQYLIGKAGAYDIINMVRACRNMYPNMLSNRFATIGHSQGAYNVLWVNTIAKQYCPELQLVATCSAAPPTVLAELVEKQIKDPGSWAIGPEIAISWPTVYPNITPMSKFMSMYAANNYKQIAHLCLDQVKHFATARFVIRDDFFNSSPLKDESWKAALLEQSPIPFHKSDPPLLLMHGGKDKICPAMCAQIFGNLCKKNGAKVEEYFKPDSGHTDILYDSTNWKYVLVWLRGLIAP